MMLWNILDIILNFFKLLPNKEEDTTQHFKNFP